MSSGSAFGCNRFAEEVAVHDYASRMLTCHDAVALADFQLALRWYGESGGGTTLEWYNSAAVTDAGAETIVGAHIAFVDFARGLLAELLESSLFALRVFENVLQLAFLLVQLF